MPYVKTVWETGDLITAEGMNNVEDAVESAVSDAETALSKITNMSLTINSNMELVVTM